MQKFHFKLQPLLNKERIYENECIDRLRIIQDTYLNEKDKLDNLKKSKIVCQDELKYKKQSEISSDELRTYDDYFLKLGNVIDEINSKLKEMRKKLETVQDELVKIVKKRKALEKLRDRWEEEHKSYLASLANKEMDDIAEGGVAAHWKYKGSGEGDKFDRKLSWLKQILEFRCPSVGISG